MIRNNQTMLGSEQEHLSVAKGTTNYHMEIHQAGALIVVVAPIAVTYAVGSLAAATRLQLSGTLTRGRQQTVVKPFGVTTLKARLSIVIH